MGALGRRGGAGRRKPIADGGGDGDESITLVASSVREGEAEEGIIGIGEGGFSGEGGFEEVDDDGSISGSFLDRRALWVSSWNKPELLRAT